MECFSFLPNSETHRGSYGIALETVLGFRLFLNEVKIGRQWHARLINHA